MKIIRGKMQPGFWFCLTKCYILSVAKPKIPRESFDFSQKLVAKCKIRLDRDGST